MEIDAQQVTKVERGYHVYEANCARCHGPQGEGGEGPVLNRQDKLFSHLNEAYIRNVLTVGGRYVCGDPLSQMPVWSDKGNPPGPLNYRQIEELIAFLLATNDETYIVRDEHLLDPEDRPDHGQGPDVHGLARPELHTRARRDARTRTAGSDEFASAAPGAGCLGRGARRRSRTPTVVDIAALEHRVRPDQR